ncbi:hypothetical protein [Streptomyces griseus]|uniref:hypothetical protein n=1 Tax=Streptomyces griseus TaxID=1911 RepID=UPI003687E243
MPAPPAQAEPPAPAAPAPAVPAEVPVRRRPRGRTTLIIAAAALLGISAGVAVGYGVQAEREPTPLTALSQPGIGYPAKPAAADRAPLPAAQDRRVRTDGDLRKLLVDRPKGAKKAFTDGLGLDDGWEPIDEYVQDYYDDPHYMFETLAAADLRRVASASWTQGKYRETTVELIQFRSGDLLGAADHFSEQMMYMPSDMGGADNVGDPIKGSREGRYFLYPVQREAGYLPSYRARALAVRGDIALDINIFDTVPISKKVIRTLAERQLERL